MSQTPGPTRSAATRYLCAAAHLDETFRLRAINELLFQPHRAVAPSFGVDIVPVLRHCLLAHRRVLLRDGVVTGLWLLALLVVPALAWPMLVLGLIVWAAAEAAGPRLRALTGGRQLGCLPLLAILVGAFLLLSLISTVLGGAFGQLRYLLELTSFVFTAPQLVFSVFAGLILTVIFPALMVAVQFTYRAVAHNEIVDSLQPEAFARRPDPAAPGWAQERLDYLADAQGGNVTYVAENTLSPYVGSGPIGWSSSFAVPLVRADDADGADGATDVADVADGGAAADLSATDIYEQLRSAIVGLGHPNTPADRRFSSLKIQDRLYVNGRLRPDSPYLTPPPVRPRAHVDRATVEAVTAAERGQTRRYLVVRVATWAGEVETSIFFYAAVRGNMLFLEYTGTTLAPIAQRYHAIDSYERLGPHVLARLLGRSVLDLLLVAPGAPLRLIAIGVQHLQRRKLQGDTDREMRSRLAFDYGSRLSLRELGTGQEGWFAVCDADEIQKVVVRRAVAAIAQTLADHGFDLMEFESRSNVVINQSTTHLTGATITNSSVATGSAARAAMGPLGTPGKAAS